MLLLAPLAALAAPFDGAVLPVAAPVASARALRSPCGTPRLFDGTPPRRFPPAPPFAGAKAARDAYGTFPHELVGENFVVKWGDTGRIDDSDAEALLEAFEHAWTEEIDVRGFPAPAGADQYLFNIYIGDTGDGTPDGYGTSGYFNRDSDGYPMVVISAATLSDHDWMRGTAAHEFFHAVQDVTERYSYSGDSAWYWEATAMWIEGEVLEDYEEYVAFLYGYALLPHLPVHFFDYPDTGALQEYHQYGAFIFPRYLSEVAADSDLVRDTWLAELDADTPQEAIAMLLEERGIAMADAFGDFAARNAVWDYADGDVYAQWVDWYADYYRNDDHRVVGEVDAEGTDGLVEAPEDTLPEEYGYNIVQLARPDAPAYRVRVEVEAEGSKGHEADWRVTVVQSDTGGVRYTAVPIVDGAGEVLLEDVGEEPLYLVAAAVPPDARSEEVFAWSYAITPEDPAEDSGTDPVADGDSAQAEEPGGCGCDSGAAGFGGLGLLVAAGMVVRRRG